MRGETEILMAARHFAEALQKSELYNIYKSSRKKIESQPDLEFKLNVFKKAQAEFEAKRGLGSPISFDEEKAVSHRYTELILNEDAGAFLKSENILLDMYRQVLDIVDNAFDFDLFD